MLPRRLAHHLKEAPGERPRIGLCGVEFTFEKVALDIRGYEPGFVAHGKLVPSGLPFDHRTVQRDGLYFVFSGTQQWLARPLRHR